MREAFKALLAVVATVAAVSAAAAAAEPAACVPRVPTVHEDCTWAATGGGTTTLAGIMAARDIRGNTVLTAPAIFAGSGASENASSAGQGGLALTNVILVGFDLPDPATASPGNLLRPSGLLPPAVDDRSPLLLRDVRILVSLQTLQHYLAFFSPGEHNTSAAANTTFVYTDGATFLHVNSWFNQHTTWQSVGLLVADTLEDALSSSVPVAPANGNSPDSSDQPQKNYVLAADAGTIVPQMLGRFAVVTPMPLILYVTSNVTLAKPPVPVAGIDVTRPVAIVGLASAPTSVDFAMQANLLIMAPGPRHQWGYVTFDSVVLENLGQGDRRSAEVAKPLTVTYTLNFWSLYYDRTTLRNSNNNATIVVHDKSDLDYMLYWLTVYRSNLPLHRNMASFLRDGLGLTTWELNGKIEPDTLSGITLYTSSVRVNNNTYTAIPQVAKPLPLPPVDPMIADALAKSGKSSGPSDLPLVVAISNSLGLKSALTGALGESAAGREYVVILRGNVSVAPNASVNWPPPGGQVVPYPVQLLGEGTNAESDRVMVQLDFGYTRGILSIPPNASAGMLTLKRVSLVGLPQGPGATEAARSMPEGHAPRPPELWTLLLWSVASAIPEAVVLDNCEVALPPGEFEALRTHTVASSDFAIPLHTAGRSAGGRRRLKGVSKEESSYGAAERAAFITASGAQVITGGQPRIQITSLSAGVVKGINITLTVEHIEKTHNQPRAWPSQPEASGLPVPSTSAGGPSRGSRAQLPVWGAVLAVAGATVVAAAAAVAAALALRRRRAAWLGASTPGKGALGPDGGGQSSKRSMGSKQLQFERSGRATPLVSADTSTAATNVSGIQIARDRPLAPVGQVTPQSNSPASAGAAARGLAGPGLFAQGSDDSVAPDCGRDGDRRQRVQAAIANLQQTILARRLNPFAQSRATGQAVQQTAVNSPVPGAVAAVPQAPAANVMPALQQSFVSTPIVNATQPGAALTATPLSPEASLGGGSSVWGLAAYQILPPDLESMLPAADTTGAPLGGALPHALTTSSEGGTGTILCELGPGSAAAAAAAAASRPNLPASEIQLLDVMGRGSFSTVYKGIWKGRFVAVKVLPLQALASSEIVRIGPGAGAGGGSDPGTYERMAVMEAVISSTLSHPNIVQVYTYHITPLAPRLERHLASNSIVFDGPAAGYELQLIMEFCEEGSLRDALDCGLLAGTLASDPERVASDASSDVEIPLTGIDYVLCLAHDVAVAMLHLHSEAMVHSDLKASNVLLARCSGAAAAFPATVPSHEAAAYVRHRFVAKVSDFGLSQHLGPEATHVSRTHAGTLSHMAPELMMEGRASRASDVYSYGILLWELLTGGRAFEGVPAPLLCIKVVQDHWRPAWPPGVCTPLRRLAEACWSPTPGARPTFNEVVSYLEGLMQHPELLESAATAGSSGSSSRAPG